MTKLKINCDQNMVAVLAAHHLQTDEAGGGMNRRRLSLATVRANQKVLLARLGQVGEGIALAWRRRRWRREE